MGVVTDGIADMLTRIRKCRGSAPRQCGRSGFEH